MQAQMACQIDVRRRFVCLTRAKMSKQPLMFRYGPKISQKPAETHYLCAAVSHAQWSPSRHGGSLPIRVVTALTVGELTFTATVANNAPPPAQLRPLRGFR